MGWLSRRVGQSSVLSFTLFGPSFFSRKATQLQLCARIPGQMDLAEAREAELGVLEVEQKFRCTDAILKRLEASSQFQGQRCFTDIYFDTSDLALTKQDMWLRSRDGHLELKTPHIKDEDTMDTYDVKTSTVNLYMEVIRHQEIAASLKHCEIHLPCEEISAHDLAEAGIQPFAKITTCRSRYKFEIDANLPFGSSRFSAFVDIDKVCFLEDEPTQTAEGDYEYVLGEVELDSESVKTLSTQQKVQVLQHGLKSLDIAATSTPGKVEEFLRRYRPTHYETLQLLGIIATVPV